MTDEQNLNKEALEQKDADGAEEETSFIEELFQSEAEEQEEVRPPKLINKNPPSEAEEFHALLTRFWDNYFTAFASISLVLSDYNKVYDRLRDYCKAAGFTNIETYDEHQDEEDDFLSFDVDAKDAGYILKMEEFLQQENIPYNVRIPFKNRKGNMEFYSYFYRPPIPNVCETVSYAVPNGESSEDANIPLALLDVIRKEYTYVTIPPKMSKEEWLKRIKAGEQLSISLTRPNYRKSLDMNGYYHAMGMLRSYFGGVMSIGEWVALRDKARNKEK